MVDKFPENRVGVLGATSMVGACLLPMLAKAGWQVMAFSRNMISKADEKVQWQRLPQAGFSSGTADGKLKLPFWISLAPIWILPEHFPLLENHGAQRLVVLSSTSRFTKTASSDPEEQALSRRFAEAEARARDWAKNFGAELVIIRPTLIYLLGQDKNISVIARFIRRFGFFPVFGSAVGLRQPVHAADVAGACFAALQTPGAANRDYNISGGETLTYRDMVLRVFSAYGRRERFLHVPLPAFRLAIALLSHFPRYRDWSVAMAERMNTDLVFDHSAAARDLGFKPRLFVLDKKDMPS